MTREEASKESVEKHRYDKIVELYGQPVRSKCGHYYHVSLVRPTPYHSSTLLSQQETHGVPSEDIEAR